MKGNMYILLCSNGLYYTGSTNDLGKRLEQHQNGEGANFTKKHLPVKLVYYEEFERIDEAFYREKQIQGWSKKKKEALINNEKNKLHELSECKNNTSSRLRSMNDTSTSLSVRKNDFAQCPEKRLRSVTGKRLCSVTEFVDCRCALSEVEGQDA